MVNLRLFVKLSLKPLSFYHFLFRSLQSQFSGQCKVASGQQECIGEDKLKGKRGGKFIVFEGMSFVLYFTFGMLLRDLIGLKETIKFGFDLEDVAYGKIFELVFNFFHFSTQVIEFIFEVRFHF